MNHPLVPVLLGLALPVLSTFFLYAGRPWKPSAFRRSMGLGDDKTGLIFNWFLSWLIFIYSLWALPTAILRALRE